MAKFEIFQVPDRGEQCWYWRLWVENNPVAKSENSLLKEEIVDSIKKLREEISNFQIFQKSDYEENKVGFEYYCEGSDDCQWYLRGNGGEIIATGETNESLKDVESNLENIRNKVKDAQITWENEVDDPAHQAKDDDTTETKGVPGS